MIADGRLYPCYETPEELALKRKAALGAGRPPVYDRAALRLTEADRTKLEAEGRTPHWRFRLEGGHVGWQDGVHGALELDADSLSDPVLIREDGRPLYTLSSVVDDGEMGVTDILRGDDHIANTAVQIDLFKALGLEVPRFAHLPLLADADGGKLSKRLGSLSLQEMREDQGIEPMTLVSLLARLGTSDPIEPFTEPAPLVESFDLARISRASARFDDRELARLNARLLHALPFEAVAKHLSALGLDGIDDRFWQVVRANVERLSDAGTWWRIANDAIDPVIDDPAFVGAAAALLPAEPWDGDTWGAWTSAVKDATGAKGKALFRPLRRALTGLDHGPDLAGYLPLIGRDRAAGRLAGRRN